jgi:hypothetical protein
MGETDETYKQLPVFFHMTRRHMGGDAEDIPVLI